jgi:hypothetical protein
MTNVSPPSHAPNVQRAGNAAEHVLRQSQQVVAPMLLAASLQVGFIDDRTLFVLLPLHIRDLAAFRSTTSHAPVQLVCPPPQDARRTGPRPRSVNTSRHAEIAVFTKETMDDQQSCACRRPGGKGASTTASPLGISQVFWRKEGKVRSTDLSAQAGLSSGYTAARKSCSASIIARLTAPSFGSTLGIT